MQFDPHLTVDRVLALGTIERESDHTLGPLDDDGLVLLGIRVVAHPRDDNDGMGFNPYRKFRARRADYVFVAAAIVAAIALVVWAFLG